MSENSQKPPSNKPGDGKLRSPVRPPNPEANSQAPPGAYDHDSEPLSQAQIADNPEAALDALRRKMERVANQFAAGVINRAQFNAIYGRYNEQRTIIERLTERNPENQAWQQVATPGHTSFLMSHFEARILYFVVYRINMPALLMMGGQQQPVMAEIEPALGALINMPNRPRVGLARKAMGKGQWMVLALGEHAVTIVMFMLEPSAAQLNRIRDLHSDFERANRMALQRNTQSLDKMVFPQRALVE